MSDANPDGEWIEIFDEASQRPYYANLKTGLTSWEKPDGPITSSDSPSEHPNDDTIKNDDTNFDDDKPVLYTSSSGRFTVPMRRPEMKSRIATAVLEQNIDRGPVEALDDDVLQQDIDDPFAGVAIADLDLNEADQFQFSDDDDDNDRDGANSKASSTLSLKDHKLMRGDSDRRLPRTHSRQTSLLAGPARRPHRRQPSDTDTASMASVPIHDYGSKLKVLDGNDWNGIQISTIPLPCWPRPTLETCRDEAALYHLQEYIAVHCTAPKSWFGSGSGAVADLDTVLLHTTGKLKAPLSKRLSERADGTSSAAQMMKNIQSFMLDRKSSKDWFGHVSRIVKVGMTSDEDIRNEIYLLLVKQLRANSNSSSIDLGWRLFLICSGLFGPSEELACYLRAFLFEQLIHMMTSSSTSSSTASDQEMIIISCIHSLQMTMSRGHRRERPMLSELSATRDLKPNLISVQLLHGESIQIAVHPQTTIEDVLALCCDFFDTDRDEGLALFETVLDGRGGRLFIPLDESDRVLDLVTDRPNRSRSVLKASGAVNDDRLLQFVFRVRMFKADALLEPRLRGGTRAMIFVEVVDSILYGYHRLTSADGIVLAALLVQSCFDCRHADLSELIRSKLDRILASRLRSDTADSELVTNIEAQIQLRGGVMTVSKARRLFLDEVQHMATFGANFFHVERLTTTKKGHIDSTALIMAISWRGLLLLDINTHDIVQGITINELLTYGQKDSKILMVIGTSIRHEKVMFSSWQADHIDRAIRLCCRQAPAIVALGSGPTPPP